MGTRLKRGGPSGHPVEVPGLPSLCWASTNAVKRPKAYVELEAPRIVRGSGSVGTDRGT